MFFLSFLFLVLFLFFGVVINGYRYFFFLDHLLSISYKIEIVVLLSIVYHFFTVPCFVSPNKVSISSISFSFFHFLHSKPHPSGRTSVALVSFFHFSISSLHIFCKWEFISYHLFLLFSYK